MCARGRERKRERECVCVKERMRPRTWMRRWGGHRGQGHSTPNPSRSNRTSQFLEFRGELTVKVAGESLIGTNYRGIDFCDCSSTDPGLKWMESLGIRPIQAQPEWLYKRKVVILHVRRLGAPWRLGPCPSTSPLEASQGQIDGSLSQLPYKCHHDRVASVGD